MKEKIKTYLLQKIGGEIQLNSDDDIFEQGLVNSMFALQLVMYLEKEFSIKIENDDLQLSNFNTIQHIEQFVQHKQEVKI
jgi:methoxymalonate biosynthesis acyl carrier protein